MEIHVSRIAHKFAEALMAVQRKKSGEMAVANWLCVCEAQQSLRTSAMRKANGG
jgi:hypothetical protein